MTILLCVSPNSLTFERYKYDLKIWIKFSKQISEYDVNRMRYIEIEIRTDFNKILSKLIMIFHAT